MASDVEKPRVCFNDGGGAKRVYDTRALARAAAKKLSKNDGRDIQDYRCPQCKQYHIGGFYR